MQLKVGDHELRSRARGRARRPDRAWRRRPARCRGPDSKRAKAPCEGLQGVAPQEATVTTEREGGVPSGRPRQGRHIPVGSVVRFEEGPT